MITRGHCGVPKTWLWCKTASLTIEMYFYWSDNHFFMTDLKLWFPAPFDIKVVKYILVYYSEINHLQISQTCADFSQEFIWLAGLPCLVKCHDTPENPWPLDILQKYVSQPVCVHECTCLWPRTNTLTGQRALDWEPADGAVNAHQCVCVCARARTHIRAHMSTIRLMFINTFCCVEWNCSEPWHSTAYFWGLNVHVWVRERVLAWPNGTTGQSLLSEALSLTDDCPNC